MKNKEKIHNFMMQMDHKLYAQLVKYSNIADLSMAQMARKAISKFIQEQYEINRQKNKMSDV